MSKETTDKDLTKIFQIIEKEHRKGSKSIEVNVFVKEYALENDYVQSVLDTMNAKGYIKTGTNGHPYLLTNQGWFAIGLSEKGLLACEEANYTGMKKLHKWWSERKEGRQLLLNILFLAFIIVSIIRYVLVGRKITTPYDVIDEIKYQIGSGQILTGEIK